MIKYIVKMSFLKHLLPQFYTLYVCKYREGDIFKLIIKSPSIRESLFKDVYITYYIIYSMYDDKLEFHQVISTSPEDYNHYNIINLNLYKDEEFKEFLIKKLYYIESLLNKGTYDKIVIYNKITSEKTIEESYPIGDHILTNLRVYVLLNYKYIMLDL